MINALSLAAPLTPTERIAELERLVADLQARVQVLEAERVRGRVQTPAQRKANPLAATNATRRARCNALKAAIASFLADAPHPRSITAKDVAQALGRAGFEPMPRDRTIRLRLAEARADAATHGNTVRAAAKVLEA